MNVSSSIQQALSRFLNYTWPRILAWLDRLVYDESRFQAVVLWVSALAAGIVAVIYAESFRHAEIFFHRLIAKYPLSTFFVTPVFFYLAWYLVRRFGPEAGGSGIPQIMAANEVHYEGRQRIFVDRLLSLRVAIVKVASSFMCVLGGGAIGREGPTLQVSACLFHFFGNQVRRYFPQTNQQTWVIAGSAAGLASAFNTPLGGIVYAIEELGVVHFHRVRTALLSAVIISGLVAQWLLGGYLIFGFPSLEVVSLKFFPVVILTGVLSGALGAAFGRSLFRLVERRDRWLGHKRFYLFPVLCGLTLSVLIYFDHRSAGPGMDVISGLLFQDKEGSFLLVLHRFLATLVSYLSGAAGGIFSPSLTVGASLGSALSYLLDCGHANLMAILGMIGFLTGVTRTPFTSFILILEMTDRHSAIFPMMVAAITAHAIANSVESRSFYEKMRDRMLAPPSI